MPERPAAPPARELLKLLLEQNEDYALFLISPEGIVTDWYRGAERVFGFTADEIVGEPVLRLFSQRDIDNGAAQHEFDLARSASRAEDDRWHVRKDGTLVWCSGVTLALRGAAGELVGFAKLARNRTDLKTQTEALENKASLLAQKAEQHQTFLAILAHELRNPLAPVASAVGLIKQARGDAAVMDTALKVIDRQLAVLGRLVDDIMDNTRVATGKVALRLRVLDLREVVEAAVHASRHLAEARGQDFRSVLMRGEVPVMGDADRLQQVLVNLITNAIKYTPRGGRVLVNLTTEGGEAIARVEDNGIGMSAEILPKVFELFTQERSGAAISGGGLGLGLSLVRELVHLHGGTVQARSDGKDKGSIFTVRLPLHDATQP